MKRTETLSTPPHGTGTGTGTSLPKLVSMAADLAKAGPPVDHAKIAQLRQAIARGEYSTDADAIAHAMVGFFRAGE